MNLNNIDSLYEKYCAERSAALTSPQFGSLVMFFPALLVIMSDGVVDEEEWIYVKYLAKFVADTMKDEVAEEDLAALQEAYYKELEYLVDPDHLERWKPEFLKVISEYVDGHPEVKEDIEDILYIFADASDGLSEEEEEQIDAIKKELHIA